MGHANGWLELGRVRSPSDARLVSKNGTPAGSVSLRTDFIRALVERVRDYGPDTMRFDVGFDTAQAFQRLEYRAPVTWQPDG